MTVNHNIPLVDLKANYLAYKTEYDEALSTCVSSGRFIGGEIHRAFSQEFSEFCGGGFTALCGSGTDALYLSIVALLGKGNGEDEIITVSHTFIATAEAITMAGYKPIFVDIEPQTCLMDVFLVEKAISTRTKAIIPVHLYGRMVDMERLMTLAEDHNLPVIEDAAQAHGAALFDKGPGQWGDAACFSFFPGKNLGAWGDGGAVFTRSEKLCEVIRMLSNHGRKQKYEHEMEGINSRLDTLQASILRVKLTYLKRWNELRFELARLYNKILSKCPDIRLPAVDSHIRHVFHLYVIQVKNRDNMVKELNNRGIGAGIHYPVPVHEQKAYHYLSISSEDLPVTHYTAQQILSLPLFPEMTNDQVRLVAENVIDTLKL